MILAKLSLNLRIQFIWFPFYECALFLARSLFHGEKYSVWARNSYPLGYSVPPVSDLDISVIFNRERVSLIEVRRRIKLLMNVMPLVREVNVYEQSDLSFVLKQINPLELERDPVLKGMFRPHRPTTDACAVVFLLRCLMTDREGLMTRAWSREKRWQFILKSVGYETRNKTIVLNIEIRRASSHYIETIKCSCSIELGK